MFCYVIWQPRFLLSQKLFLLARPCALKAFLSRSPFVGRGDALVESIPFDRRVVGSKPALASTYGPWASPSLTVACRASACILRHSPLLWSGALQKGSCCEKRYRNG